MKRTLAILAILFLLCSIPAYAQNECSTLTPQNWVKARATDSSGVVHDIECVNYTDARLNFPYLQNVITSGTFTGTFISGTASPAQSGILRLANADVIAWRNNADAANVSLAKTGAASGTVAADSLNASAFGGITLPAGSSTTPAINLNSGNGTIYSGTNVTYIGYSGATQAFAIGTGPFTGMSNGTQLYWSTTADAFGSIQVELASPSSGKLNLGTTSTNASGTLNLSTLQYRGLAQTYFVTSNFTSAANTNLQTITGLSWTFPANTAMNVKCDCYLLYSIATAAVAMDFGFQDATVAPTSLSVSALAYTATGTATEATLQNSSTTTATSVITITPSAINTIWQAQLHFFIEQPSNASTSLFSIMIKTSNSADLPTVYRGSYCTLQQ